MNPHVVPFLSSTNKTDQKSVWNTVKQLATSEISHRISQVRLSETFFKYWHMAHISQAANIGIIPRQLDFFLGLMSQNYKGNITIVPELTINDYTNLLANPTPDWILSCIKKSELNTWCRILRQYSRIDFHFFLHFPLHFSFIHDQAPHSN